MPEAMNYWEFARLRNIRWLGKDIKEQLEHYLKVKKLSELSPDNKDLEELCRSEAISLGKLYVELKRAEIQEIDHEWRSI